MSWAWSYRLPFTDDLLSPLLCGTLLLFILLHPPKEVLPAARVLHMLNTHIDALLDDTISVGQLITVIDKLS